MERSSSSSSDQRKLAQRPERVKSVDLHPTEPWILASWYSGTLCIWNYQTQALAKSLVVTKLPVRSAKFIARKQWVVAGADDMYIRVYNYNTMEKVKVFEAHSNYIRCVAVHPTLPYVLSSSDDMLIKLWDWEKGWACTQIFEGHSHYVMQVTFNPKDTNTFSSASLDGTIKIWNLALPDPNFTLDAHQKGVNCVDYFTGGDKPYLITGSDDHTAKVWNYQTKACVQTLQGHTHNVSAVYFHPELPIIITGSEDGIVCIWHATTYRLENTLNHGLERVWAIGYTKSSRQVVIGYDEGAIMVKLGREIPVASLENTRKIIWAKHNEIQTANIKTIGTDYEVKNVDWISKLPDDVLLMILSRLSTEEAIRTSVVSKRWKHVWKQMSHLVLDMQRIINSKEPLDGSNRVATLMTKVLNNHHGHLESCVIDHFSYQGANGMLNTWIRSVTCVKHTKDLTLRHHFGLLDQTNLDKFLNISPNSFSHPSLTSLSLSSYILESSHPLSNCPNLRTLKLSCILASEVGVFNRVLASCPSLEVLVLRITCFPKSGGPLKIENNKLKLLQVSSCRDIDGIRVSAASLDILAIKYTSCRRDDFVLTSPRLQFNRRFWTYVPHISYNISKEKKSIAHEEFVKISRELFIPTASLSVSVDLMSRTEVERLRQVLRLWTRKMIELEIIFKDNNGHREENECWQKNNNKDPFPNAEFRVDTVWMHNFSGSEEEFALASSLIRQGTVVKKMMIKSTSFPAMNKLKIEAAVAKLQALQTQDQWELTIKCF